MRRSMMIIISSIMITMMASACAPRQHDIEATFRQHLVRHYAEDDKAARAMNGEPLRLDLTFVDLDGDGQPEAIVRLDHPAFCGSRGCAIDVLRVQEDRIVVLGAFIAYEAALRHDVMAQRRHVMIDARAWIMSGDRLAPLDP
ncbi:hypothetical protein V6B08_01720 [Ferrovibrio sp. MS7]|uniref:hypothetical protein n=1 Tax=Ferrovibrio plantarum TaxID=3119164 RepID=UPI00313531D1